jgi:hypothetical protein
MIRCLISFSIALLSSSLVYAQPAASSSTSVVVVTLRVLSPIDPAERFEILEAVVRQGATPRPAPQSDAATIEGQSPEVVVLDDSGRILHRQPFTWSRVMTVPPMPPGVPNDGSPNAVVVAQPEVTLVLPGVTGAARVEVRPANAALPAVTRAITATASNEVNASPLPGNAPPPATPGSLNILLLASGFTPARLGIFGTLAAGVESQMRNSEPFKSGGSQVVFRLAQATTSLGCAPGCNGIARLMCCNSSAVMNAAVASGLPFDEVVVIHDTLTYAGSGFRDLGSYRTNSYSSYATAYNGVWTEEMVKHEFGHSFGNLCDEYTYGNEPYVYNACANCRATCAELAPFGQCIPSCDAAPSFFRPDPSVMLALDLPHFNNASINTQTPVDGLAKRLDYFFNPSGSLPATPTGLSAVTTANSVTLSWNASSGATNYRLEVGSASGLANLFNGLVGRVTTLSGPVGNGVYYWRLFATNSVGSSPASAEAQFTIGVPVSPPAAPTNLQAAVNGTNVTLSWSPPAAPSSPATNYIVQVGSGSGASNLFNGPIGDVTTVSGGVGNGTYFWRVIASNSAGSSPPSAESQFTVGCTAAPGAPGSLTHSLSGRQVTFAWSAPVSGGAPTEYVIEAGRGPGLSDLASLPTGNTAVVLTIGAPPGTYYVRIRARNGCGTSGVSNEVVVVVS